MNEQFLSAELSLKLKQLGFNEECMAYYITRNGELRQNIDLQGVYSAHNGNIPSRKSNNSTTLGAPLWQQAFDWFESLGYFPNIYPSNPIDVRKTKSWHWGIDYSEGKYDNDVNIFTKEEVKIACLNKLIELENDRRIICTQ